MLEHSQSNQSIKSTEFFKVPASRNVKNYSQLYRSLDNQTAPMKLPKLKPRLNLSYDMSARDMVRFENGLDQAFGVAGYKIATPESRTIVLPWGKGKGEVDSFLGHTLRLAKNKLSPSHYSPSDLGGF